jgi:hypothetical protein
MMISNRYLEAWRVRARFEWEAEQALSRERLASSK